MEVVVMMMVIMVVIMVVMMVVMRVCWGTGKEVDSWAQTLRRACWGGCCCGPSGVMVLRLGVVKMAPVRDVGKNYWVG